MLQIDPDFFESISNRSASHLALRDYARAIDDSDKASIALPRQTRPCVVLLELTWQSQAATCRGLRCTCSLRPQGGNRPARRAQALALLATREATPGQRLPKKACAAPPRRAPSRCAQPCHAMPCRSAATRIRCCDGLAALRSAGRQGHMRRSALAAHGHSGGLATVAHTRGVS